MDSIAGYGFSATDGDDAIAEEYSGKHWACYRCSVPDYEVVRDPFYGPQRLKVRCPANPLAPFAGSCSVRTSSGIRNPSTCASNAVEPWCN